MQSKRINTASSAFFFLLQFSHFGPRLAQAADVAYIVEGCYSSPGDLTLFGDWTWQSYSWCQGRCLGQGSPVMALYNGDTCYCGDLLPPLSDITSDGACNVKCTGYGQDDCGGTSAYRVLLTGLDPSVGHSGGSAPAPAPAPAPPPVQSSAPPQPDPEPTVGGGPVRQPVDPKPQPKNKVSTIPPHVVYKTVGGNTVVTTVPPKIVTQPTPAAASSGNNDDDDGGSNTTGIAVGVVVGILVVAAIVGGVWFFLRRRRKNVEKEHRRQDSYNAFIQGGAKADNSSDTRLDPGMMVERRTSAGSVFADNQDYSRRILKVTNPDGT